MAYAREHLAGYKVPRSVSFMDELPQAPLGQDPQARAARAVLGGPHHAGLTAVRCERSPLRCALHPEP